MKRISLALVIVVSVLIATATTHAAATKPLHSSSITGLVRHVDRLGQVSGSARRLAHHEVTTLSVPHSNSNQSAQTLALPASAFSPATINTGVSGTITASTADGNWFRAMHTSGSAGNYESFGFVYGYYQRADWSATSPAGAFRYQGSYMGTATNAKNAFNDGVNYTSQLYAVSPQSCTNDATVLGCQYLIYNWGPDNNGTTWTEEYAVLQYNACLAEIAGDVPQANFSANATQFNTTINNLAKAAVTAMSNTCGTSGTNPTSTPTPIRATPTPTSPPAKTAFGVVAVRFEKNGAKPDWSLKNSPLTQTKAGTKVQLAIYINVQSLASSSVAIDRHYVVKLNGKKFIDYTGHGDITDVDTYRYTYGPITLKKAGTYALSITAQMGGKSDGAQSQLQALKKYVAPKKVTFSINNVSLTNGTIHVGQQANVRITFTIQNLKGHTNGRITRTILARINGVWKGVSTNSSSTLVVNGKNTASVTTQLNAPGTFQIQVTVTVGASAQSKTVPVTVIP